MRLFVTGGTGFLGSHFLNAAAAKSHEIVALRRPGSNLRVAVPGGIRWIEGSMGASEAGWFAGCDALVHLAAAGVSPQPVDWGDAHRFNVAEPLALAKAAFDAGIRRMLVCGSCFEYGRAAERYDFIPPDAPLEPVGPYATSKAAASLAFAGFARTLGISLLLARPFHMFGEGQHTSNFWPSLRKAALAGEDFPMTPGEQVRDFIPVEQVADRFLSVLALPGFPSTPWVENVGTGTPQTLRQFAEDWWQEWGATGKLLLGALPYRENEVMRYVPEVKQGEITI